jgi:copper chaperone
VSTLQYSVLGMTCAHCVKAVQDELDKIDGVDEVTVDLESKQVTVVGSALDDAGIREAIEEAGYAAE